MRVLKVFFSHVTDWGIVWFGVLFWGSIFNAISVVILDDPNLIITLIAYSFGLLLGFAGKYKGWSWIN